MAKKGKKTVLHERAGTCMICDGDIVRKVTKEVIKHVPTTKYDKGFFCAVCGLKYEFPPPKYLHQQIDDLLKNARERVGDLDDVNRDNDGEE